MGFAQLYYTSCESGLSDFAGFQFNAATPGVPPQVLREVEALTAYEPPRSLGYRPSAAEIAACPVNLAYRHEPTAVLANVVFVGLDFSQRLGNYFAHALVAQTRDDQFDPILPIELWGSPVWAGEPIAGRELPALTDLPTPANQQISRVGVDRFLAANDCPDQLTTLVTAAENAVLRQGRSIVIVESDSTAAAQWIAAISFLLPPALAHRMSFATYRHRPEYSDAHVIATLPESDFDLDESTFHGYVVFDATSGQVSEVAPDPAAVLLVRAGAEQAATLWQRVAELVDCPGDSLAECYPVLVTAAVLERLPVSAADLDALAEWLESNPETLRPAAQDALLPIFLDHPALASHHLRSLGGLAPTAGAQLRASGERVLGPALVRAGGGDGLATLTCSRELLEGALAHLAAVAAEDPAAVIEVFAGGLGDLIEDDVPLPLPLRRAALLARCRTALLDPDDHLSSGTAWLVRAIVDPSRNPLDVPVYRALCEAIEDGTVTETLPTVAQDAVSSFLATARDLEQAGTESEAALTLQRLAGCYPQQRPAVQDLLRQTLPGLIDALAGSRQLPGAVADCPDAVLAAYLATADRRLATRPVDVAGAARLFETLPLFAPALSDVLRRGLRQWSAPELEQLRDRLLDRDSRLASGFDEWRGRHLGGRLSRSLRRLTQRRAETGSGR
jgi:hypothetical protein